MQRVDEIQCLPRVFLDPQQSLLFLAVTGEKRLPNPSYAGASVTAEIMSVHFQSRREPRKERERALAAGW